MEKSLFAVLFFAIIGTSYAGKILKIEIDMDNKMYILSKIPELAIVIP